RQPHAAPVHGRQRRGRSRPWALLRRRLRLDVVEPWQRSIERPGRVSGSGAERSAARDRLPARDRTLPADGPVLAAQRPAHVRPDLSPLVHSAARAGPPHRGPRGPPYPPPPPHPPRPPSLPPAPPLPP